MPHLPLDNYVSELELPSSINAELQQDVVKVMEARRFRPLPANFTRFFDAGLRLAADFPALSLKLNPNRLNQNCYFCTVAALTRQTVNELVAQTETMQQDTATLDETVRLFKDAGVESILTSDYVMSGETPEQLWQRTWDYLDKELSVNEALGLAWTRPDNAVSPCSGHVVVVAKDDNGAIAALDYQSGVLTDLSKTQPPENLYHHGYHVFQRAGAKATAQWPEAWDFIVAQYVRKRSDKGVAGVIQDGQLHCFFYRLADQNTLWAEINAQPTQLFRNSDPRGNHASQNAVWRIWPA